MARDPGNKISSATNLGALARPKTVRNLVGGDDPFDFYKVVFRSPGFLSASLSGLKSNANLTLLNRAGKTLQRSRKPGKREDLIQAELGNGVYFLRVEGKASSTRYRLRLSKGPTQDDSSSIATAEFIGPLSDTRNIEGVLGGANTEDYYRFNLNVTRDVTLSLEDPSGRVVLDLLDLNGNVIPDSGSAATAQVRRQLLPNLNGNVIPDVSTAATAQVRRQPLPTGSYAVRARTPVQEQGSVPYRVRMSAVLQPVQPQGNLEFQPSIGAIATLNGSLSTLDVLNPIRLGSFADDYVLSGVTPGQQVQINLTSTAFDPYLQIVDEATGQEVAFNDDATGSLNSELVFTVPTAATYRVRVTSFGSAAVGDYTLTTSPPAQSIGTLAERAGALEPTDSDNPLRIGSRHDDYRLTGVTPGQELRINLDSSAFDPYLQIVNAATGELIDFDDDSGGSNNSALLLTAQPGTNYILRVTSFNNGVTGAYTLRTGPNVDAIAPSQIIGNTLDWSDSNNSLRSGSFSDDYLLTGASVGQTIRVNLSADFDTYLQLVNAQTDDLIDYNDDSNGTLNSELTFTVESGINYIIRASSYTANAEGNYTLETSASAPIVNITGDQTIDGSLSSTDSDNSLRTGSFYDEYQLTGLGVGQTIRVNLGAEGFDTYLQLVNGATNELIDFNDDANNTLNSELSFTVQAGIDYRLRATSFNPGSTGSYVLTTATAGNWVNNTILDPELRGIIGSLAADNELSRNDMIGIFREAARDDAIVNATEQADLREVVRNAPRFNMRDHVQYLSHQVSNSISPNMNAASLEQSIGRHFLGTETPTNRFNGLTFGYVNVQGNVYGAGGNAPSIAQLAQGGLGDSAFLAAVGSVLEARPADIVGPNGMFIDNGDGTFTVRFYSATNDNGVMRPEQRAEYVTVDRRLASVDGNPIFAGQFSASAQAGQAIGGANGFWAGLLERAYVGWQQNRAEQNGYNLIGNGEVPDRPMSHISGQAVAGGVSASVGFGGIQGALADQRAVTAVSSADSTYTMGGQTYSVLQAYVNGAGQQRIQLRNPLGVDGRTLSGLDDGLIDLSFDEYVSALQSTYLETV